jgi:hypothetical protein
LTFPIYYDRIKNKSEENMKIYPTTYPGESASKIGTQISYHWESHSKDGSGWWISGITYYSLEEALKNKPKKSEFTVYRLICETHVIVSTVIKEA